jgi:hypothetical protein
MRILRIMYEALDGIAVVAVQANARPEPHVSVRVLGNRPDERFGEPLPLIQHAKLCTGHLSEGGFHHREKEDCEQQDRRLAKV